VILEAGDRRRMLVATVLTVAALPFLWSAGNDSAAGSSGSLAALSPTGGIVLAPSAESASPELIEPGFLGGAVETLAPKPIRYVVAAPPSGEIHLGKAGYRRLASASGSRGKVCQTSLAPFNTRIVVTNTDNGYKIDCLNVNTKPVAPDLLIVVDTDAFVLLTDLAESPIPVELSW
jgi:hypothetical protein